MLASGNSSAPACASCLLAAMKREIPFARSKGIDPDVYDRPFDEARGYMDESARDALSAYESRIDAEGVVFGFEEGGAEAGDGRYTISIVDSGYEGDDEEDDD